MKPFKGAKSQSIFYSMLTIVFACFLIIVIRGVFWLFSKKSSGVSYLDDMSSYINHYPIFDGVFSYISIIAAITIALILYEQSENISSLGNYVRLQTKKEVLSLLQALDNIQFIEKCLKQNMVQTNLNLDYELECIDKFMCSTASKFVADVLDERCKGEGVSFMFLMQLLMIRYNPENEDMVKEVMEKLLSLSDSDFKTMDKIAENLNKNFCEWYKNQTYLSKYFDS